MVTGTLTAPQAPGVYCVKSKSPPLWNCQDALADYEDVTPPREWTAAVILAQ